MIRRIYDLVMDPDRNPLSALPKIVRFQYMLILSYMWSAVFTIWVGSLYLLGPSLLGHSILLVGVFFTADTFRRARADGVGHRNRMRGPRNDGALYDDLWGAPVSPS